MTNQSGKTLDVFFEDISSPIPGFDYVVLALLIWADPGNVEIIRSTPGVVSVDCSSESIGPLYIAVLDPRYDREYVKAEIAARIKIEGKI